MIIRMSKRRPRVVAEHQSQHLGALTEMRAMTPTTAKPRLRAVLTMTLMVATAAGVAATGPASAAPTTTSGVQHATMSSTAAQALDTAVPVNLPIKPTAAAPKEVQPVVSDPCANRKPAATGVSEPVVCLTATPNDAPAPTQAAVGSVTPNTVVGSNCKVKTAVWQIDRTTACIRSWGVTAEIREDPRGPVVGKQHFLVNQNIILNTNSDGFVENDTIVRDSASGEFSTSRLQVIFGTNCSSSCQTHDPVVSINLLTIGSSQDFSASYFDQPLPGKSDTFNIFYTLNVIFLDFPLRSDSLVWTSPEPIRCDDMLRPRSPGCVFPMWGPLLNLSVSVYGAAAVNVAIGQRYLAQPFGTQASPLTRGDPAVSDPNRDAICDGTFFPSLILVQDDSCDEYPFASSQQSGAQRGFTGAACLEIVPLKKSNGEWVIYVAHGNIGVHWCLRGHVPNGQNRAVGTAVGTMYTNYRMLTGDAYAIEVDN
jgi:hypothetical protein